MNTKTETNNIIPQPPVHPLIKNLGEIDKNGPVQSMMRMAKIYGPIFRFSLPHRDILIVSSQELVDELCDEKRFDKKLHGPLQSIRALAGDGLFTANTSEPNWQKAHKILTPAFSPASIRNMYDQMLDIAEQMVLKWERFGEDAVIDVADNMTRLTLDTIALCAFDYRFNSFYQNEMHPFVDSMVRGLEEAGARARRLSVQNKLMLFTQKKFEEDIAFMNKIADQLIENRKKDPDRNNKKDLLSLMLSGVDSKTGEGLSDENIRFQLITFLIAGHETTSGLLSFTLYELLKNPEVLNKAREEVDRVLGTETPTVKDLSKLTYIDQILKESLRVWPTAPAFAVTPHEDTVIGGKYQVKAGDSILILLPSLHRDPKVWGNDVERFDPERFSPENYGKLPPNSWKPFGNGKRACIGRAFAMQEAQLVLAMILQNFDIFEEDSSYKLKVKETLTLKPEGFKIRVRKRGNTVFRRKANTLENIVNPLKTLKETAHIEKLNQKDLTPLLIIYGSNSGSAEAFAQKIVSDAKNNGYSADIGTMDEYSGQLPKEGAVVVITSSYEGLPPDNAKHFVGWLDSLKQDELKDVKYTVFGCGNRDWVRTYQAIPKKVDFKMEEAGATRLFERGEADARGDFFGDFDKWYESFWTKLSESFGKEVKSVTNKPLYEIEVLKESRSAILRQNELQMGEILENRELVDMSSPIGRSKRHIEIKLPENMKYRAGDYLAILPINPREYVDSALNRFGFSHDSHIIINKSSDSQSSLPTGYPVNIFEILASYVELSQPATRKNIEVLIQYTQEENDKEELNKFLENNRYLSEILEKRISILDLLNRFDSCKLPFAIFLELLSPMKVRQYSISSSPLRQENTCSLTVAIVDAPSWSGKGRFKGVASNYLASSVAGMKVSVAIRPSNAGFHLPDNAEIPVIMICAGTGLAPFHGFIQERAIQKENGRNMAKGLLFFGCEHPDVDFIYKDEILKWQNEGVIDVKTAFSALPENGIKYVQDRLWHDRKAVMELMNQNAIIYVCGDGRKMAPAVRETFIRIYQEYKNCTIEESEKWVTNLEKNNSRYVSDVFS